MILFCDTICWWLAAGRWIYPGTPVYSTHRTDRPDITEMLFKVALNTITLTHINHININFELYQRSILKA